jgi:hypothetical protein
MGFTARDFAAFWAKPDPALVPHAVTPDVIGHWPGRVDPVRGVVEYAKAIADVIALLPDVRLEVLEHATNGDDLFIRWRSTGTGLHGRFAFSGIDRIRRRNGRVAENVIVFDTAQFEQLSGLRWPRSGATTG